ncbi:MAG: hypothetical protein OEY94_06350 [Alphaproteobacteria bacterium]|nr:hypothetical protein [Alphaproteobacteria bacterium]
MDIIESDTYFNTQREAIEAASRLRVQLREQDILVRVERSPYGGYRLKKIPVDIAMDMVEHFPSLISTKGIYCEQEVQS